MILALFKKRIEFKEHFCFIKREEYFFLFLKLDDLC